MPSYPLTFPSAIIPQSVHVSRRIAAAVVTSPTSFAQQVYQHPGKRWQIDVKLQPLPADLAAEMTQFFYDLDGPVGTFNFNLTPHCPGLSPAPGVVEFRLADPENGWSAELATVFGFTFRAIEAL